MVPGLDLPDNTVESRYAEEIPLRTDPAPKLSLCQYRRSEAEDVTHESRSIYLPLPFRASEEIHQSRYERASIASKEVLPLLSPHALCSPSSEKSKVDVEAHA